MSGPGPQLTLEQTALLTFLTVDLADFQSEEELSDDDMTLLVSIWLRRKKAEQAWRARAQRLVDQAQAAQEVDKTVDGA